MILNVEQSFNKYLELCNASDIISMDDFMYFDADLKTIELPADDEIVISVDNQDEFQEISDESDCDEIPKKKPYRYEML